MNFKYENFKQYLSSNFLTLPPLGGGIKNGVIEKVVGELKLQENKKNQKNIRAWFFWLFGYLVVFAFDLCCLYPL